MTTDTEATYNGWHNYETWLVNLWLANDEDTYNHIVDLARKAKSVTGLTLRIKTFVLEGLASGYLCGLKNDLEGRDRSKIDWKELAEHWFADEHSS